MRLARSARYGVVAQACSSATNFGLVVIAGHILGPEGVGTLFVGFAAYLVLLGFQRSLITTPLVVGSASSDQSERAVLDRRSLTLTLASTVVAVIVLAGTGLVLPDDLGRGMVLFAPWIVPALVQDLGRSIVFRDRSGVSTAYSDAAWVLAMGATVPAAVAAESDWAVVTSWGVGATVGAACAVIQIRWRPSRFQEALSWWRRDVWRFGRWLAMSGALYSVATYSSVVSLVSILGARDYGGLRAVQTLFAPLTLLGPALSLPGLPAVSRLVSESPRQALRLALGFGALIMVLTTFYVCVVYAFPDLLKLLFGSDFAEFRSIVAPIGIGQILLSPALGLGLFIRAQQRGRLLFWSTALYSVLSVALAVSLASLFGLTGAAWAGVVAATVYVLALTVAVRTHEVPHVPPGGAASHVHLDHLTDLPSAERSPKPDDG